MCYISSHSIYIPFLFIDFDKIKQYVFIYYTSPTHKFQSTMIQISAHMLHVGMYTHATKWNKNEGCYNYVKYSNEAKIYKMEILVSA